jgi:hypothetical protein
VIRRPEGLRHIPGGSTRTRPTSDLRGLSDLRGQALIAETTTDRPVSCARAHNIPPRVTTARRPGGTGPLTRSFLRIDRRAGDVVLSAFKQAEERSSVIVRTFNPGDEEAHAVISMDARIAQAFVVNFLEERQDVLAVEQDASRSGSNRSRFR